MLHLLYYSRYRDDQVCPYEMTQRGIAESLGIRREYATVLLIRLKEKKYVDWRKAHIAGSGVNRKVYDLTHLGLKIARQLQERTGSAGEAWNEVNGVIPPVARQGLEVSREEDDLDPTRQDSDLRF